MRVLPHMRPLPCLAALRRQPRWQLHPQPRLSVPSSRRTVSDDSFMPSFSHHGEQPSFKVSPDVEAQSPEEKALEHAQVWATRPSAAPRGSPNLRHLIDNPDEYRRSCSARNYTDLEPLVDLICDRVIQIKTSKGRLGQLKKLASQTGLSIRVIKTSHRDDRRANRPISHESLGELAAAQATHRELKDQITALESGLANNTGAEVISADANVMSMALALPNVLSPRTPIGSVAKILRHINFYPRDPHTATARSYVLEETGQTLRRTQESPSHVDIGQELGILNMTAGSIASGWGWYYLLGAGARLEQALIQFALDTVQKAGWRLVSPPSLVYSHMATACGFQPRDQNGETQTYTIARKEKAAGKPELSLAATAEIPLATMLANTIIREVPGRQEPLRGDPNRGSIAQGSLMPRQVGHGQELERTMPIRTVAVSRCYRAEAGARGAGTRGLYRVHEFTKVEMFAWTRPNEKAALDAMEQILLLQANILKSLGLKCRMLEMPSADLGAAAWRKIDIETWFPSRWNPWGEVTSASICTDYQTRRLATRIRLADQSGSEDGGDRKLPTKSILEAADQDTKNWETEETHREEAAKVTEAAETAEAAEAAEAAEPAEAAEASEAEAAAAATTADAAKRLEYVLKNKDGNKAATYPWTVNGTALAVPRVLAAILENNWNVRERSVRVPEVLIPYMGGQKKIGTRDWT